MAWNKIRTLFLIPSRQQFLNWNLPSKLTFAGYALAVFSVIWSMLPQTPPLTAYDLSDARRADFLDFLQVTPEMHVDTLRIGCVPASEESCVAATKFAKLFADAGWEIEGNQVFKVDTTLPVEGVSIVERNADILALPQLPPNRGRWAVSDISDQIINSAFRFMDNPINPSSDPSLSDHTLGIYFGPDTKPFTSLPSGKKRLGERLLPLVKSGLATQQLCMRESVSSCKAAIASWNSRVTSFLDDQYLDADVTDTWAKLSFNDAAISKDSIDRQLNFLTGLFLITKQGSAPP